MKPIKDIKLVFVLKIIFFCIKSNNLIYLKNLNEDSIQRLETHLLIPISIYFDFFFRSHWWLFFAKMVAWKLYTREKKSKPTRRFKIVLTNFANYLSSLVPNRPTLVYIELYGTWKYLRALSPDGRDGLKIGLLGLLHTIIGFLNHA